MKKQIFFGTVLGAMLSVGCNGTVNQSEVQSRENRCNKIMKDASSYSSFVARSCYSCAPNVDFTPFVIAYTACKKSLNELKKGKTEIPL